MQQVELTLTEWLALYRQLCDAEQSLAAVSPEAPARTQLQADVARLQAEVDAGWAHLDAELCASKVRAQ